MSAALEKLDSLMDSLFGGSKPELTKKPVKVMVSGCFDLLHAGHMCFLKEAASHGDQLFVRIGSDENIRLLKHHEPYMSQDERLYMLRSLDCVYDAQVALGSGDIDFGPDLDLIKPDIFLVNEDGDRPAKKEAIQSRGIEYRVEQRVTAKGLPKRSSTMLKKQIKFDDTLKQQKKRDFPWRLCLCGGWLDQPWVSSLLNQTIILDGSNESKFHTGSVITVNVKYHAEFTDRSGLATSTRQCALRMFKDELNEVGSVSVLQSGVFDSIHEQLAHELFVCENRNCKSYVSGSQDHLGLVLPGINRLDYDGHYWPSKITNVCDLDMCQWLESHLRMVPIGTRPDGYDSLKDCNPTAEGVQRLAQASDDAWKALVNRDAKLLGDSLTRTMLCWKEMFPETVPDELSDLWQGYQQQCEGVLFSGAGGGFLMCIVSNKEDELTNAFRVQIECDDWWIQERQMK